MNPSTSLRTRRLILIDGNALLHRAYHALPPMTTSKGELVNAVYGFTSMILKAKDELKPQFWAVAWDEKGPTFRHQQYTQYKATRGPTDEALSNQYDRVFEITKALGIAEFRLSGYEADDLIGTLAMQALKQKDLPAGRQGLEVVVLTGDRDILQIIDRKIKVFMPRKTLTDVGLYGREEFAARYGFSPSQLPDYKALAGDQSDNIPGVLGIGDISATKLIQQFGTIEKIYDPKNLKTLPERLQKLLAEGVESAVMSKKLATLDLKAQVKLDLKKCEVDRLNREKIRKVFEELEFKSLLNRMPDLAGPAGSQPHSMSSTRIRSLRVLNGAPRSPSPTKSSGSDFATSDLDKSVVPILQKMSETGVLIDLKFLEKLGKELKNRLTKLEKEIYSKIGHEINLNSPKQLQIVLFDELKLPVFRKTKTGRSTDEETLHELSLAHPCIPLILEYRQLFKLVSTYIDALPKSVKEDGRIHSTFNVEGSATGRISSQNPNLQNIPIKTELAGEIRKAIVAPKGKILLTADYSQIELRIMAHLSEDPGLKRAFEKGLDIHGATAAKIFKVPIEKVTKSQRMVGKTMNFATLYGQGSHALSRQLKVEYAVAQQYIVEYFEQFPKVRQWMQKTLEFGYKKGYVETLWGRRRYIPELQAGNRQLKAAGERMAINHPVQGTAADMIKKAMVDIDRAQPTCSMILQVHDELLFECDGSASSPQVIQIAKMVKEKMENALKLSVPVVVDLKIGPNWGEMKVLNI